MESVRDIAACALEGVMVRDASAFHRIASADVFLFDHHPALESAGLEVREVQALDGIGEDDVLRLAAAAFSGLADERSAAPERGVRRASDDRPARPAAQLPGPRDHPARPGPVHHHPRRAGRAAGRSPGLEVSADGRPIGRIAFGRSSVPRAAEAIRELRRHGPLTIGLVSDRPDAEAAPLAAALGMDFHVGGLSSEAKAVAVRSSASAASRWPTSATAAASPMRRARRMWRSRWPTPSTPRTTPPQVLVLRTDLDWAAGLRDRSRSHVARLRTIHGAILVPNLFCIAGAFFLGFTSLSAVVLTNLGTLAVFSGLPNLRGPRALPASARGGRP